MKTKLIFAGLLVLTIISCRRKSSEDYKYYQPSSKADTTTQVADTLAQIDTVSINKEEQTRKEEIRGVDLINDHYFIVVASYAVEDYAQAQKEDLLSQGYKPEIFMIDDDGWYKLAVVSYPTRKEAESALARLKQKEGIFNTARIVFKKNKP